MERTNLAARAGRWSAAHWKTALTPGSSSASSRSRLGRGRKASLKQADTASGETREAQKILDGAGFAGHAGESVLVQSKTATVGRRGVPGRGRRRRSHRVRAAGGRTRALAARVGQPRPGLRRRPFGARPVRDPRRRGQGDGQGPAGPRRRSRTSRPPTPTSRSPSSARRARTTCSTRPSATTSSGPSTRRCR